MSKISQYPDGGAIQSLDRFVIARGGVNYSILGSNMGGGKLEGLMQNGKLSVTVASNNITVAIKTFAGADPSASDPVDIYIAGTKRSITSALSVTVNAGTNSFNAGSSELATKAIDYFPYLGWRAASSAVVIGFGRFPFARVYSDFSATATNEKYGAFSTAPASTDDVVNIGRFEATLSAGAGYTWSVPTYTNSNLIQHPVFVTRWLDWVPTYAGFSANPTNVVHQYQLVHDTLAVVVRHGSAGTSNGTTLTLTAPWTARTVTNAIWSNNARGEDNSAALTNPALFQISSASNSLQFFTTYAGAAWTGSGTKRILSGELFYPI